MLPLWSTEVQHYYNTINNTWDLYETEVSDLRDKKDGVMYYEQFKMILPLGHFQLHQKQVETMRQRPKL